MERRSSRFNITHPSKEYFQELLPEEFDKAQKLLASVSAVSYFDKNLKEMISDAVIQLKTEALERLHLDLLPQFQKAWKTDGNRKTSQ